MTETVLIDVAWSKPKAAAIKAAGYSGVLGYISHDASKDLGAKQAKLYIRAGLHVGFVFETTATEAEHHTATGVADRRYAEQRAEAMGYPKTCPIFYAVDEDVSPEKVQAYFAGVFDGNTHPAGPYGSAEVVTFIAKLHPKAISWQTVAWSGDVISAHASLYQRNTKTKPKVAGVASNGYDEDVVLKPIKLWNGELMPTASPGHHPPNPGPGQPTKPKREKTAMLGALKVLFAAKAKAFIGAILAAAVAYEGTAITTHHAATLHGLELAVTAAVVTFAGVHQAANKPTK